MSLQLTMPINPITGAAPHACDRATPSAIDYARRCVFAMRRLWWSAYWNLEVKGIENLPRRGPALLCANHVSHLDAPAILASLPRATALRTSTAAARDVWGERPVRDFVSRLLTNAIPIQRCEESKGFARGLRDLEAVLQDRRPLILFPEGRRSPDGRMLEFKPGAAMLALRTGAPIVPVHIKGVFQALPRKGKVPRPANVRVHFGKPIDPRPYRKQIAEGRITKREAYDLMTERLRQAVAALTGD